MSDAVVDVPVDSTERAEQDAAGSTRRRVQQDHLAAERRRVDWQLGAYEYAARAPKLIVWQQVATMLSEQISGNRGTRRRSGDRERADTPRVSMDRIRLTSALTHFIRGCVSADDWADIEADLADPDNTLDTPDLWASGFKLVIEFQPDMSEACKAIGMKMMPEISALTDAIDPDTGLLKNTEAADEQPKPAKKTTAKRRR